MAECTPIDLEGGTLENPCIHVWGCGAFDYQRLRRKLQLERNTLVTYLNAYNKLVMAGRAKHTSEIRIIYTLAFDQSARLLYTWRSDLIYETAWWERWTAPGYANAWNNEREAYKQACKELAVMASRCHSAVCDVANAIEAAGDKVPSTPIAPPPAQGWGDEILDFSLKIAKSIGVLALAAGAIFGGLYVVNKSRERNA